MIQMVEKQAKVNYDKKTTMPPTFHIGDKVFLQHDNISTNVPSKKLSSRFLEPFPVISRILDVVYCLKLPKNLRIHHVFHVSLLKCCCLDTIVSQHHTIPLPIITLYGDLEYEVYKILDSKFLGRWKKLYYLVSWEGYRREENSWELATNLENAPKAIAEFHRLHPQALGPGQET